MHRSATTLLTVPFAGAFTSSNLELRDTNPLYDCYIFADLLPVRFSSDHCACDIQLRQFFSAFKAILIATVLIGICKAEWLLPYRPETAPLHFRTAASVQLQETLCLS